MVFDAVPKCTAGKPTLQSGFLQNDDDKLRHIKHLLKKMLPVVRIEPGALRYEADVHLIVLFQHCRSSLDFGL